MNETILQEVWFLYAEIVHLKWKFYQIVLLGDKN